MGTKTNTLNLTLPAKEDFYNVEEFNQNFQKIDDFANRKDNPHEVTAAQVGALPLTGGTLSGGLKINNEHGSFGAIEQYLSLAHKSDPNSNNYRNLSISNGSELKNSLILHQVVDGVETNAFIVYGEHNFFVESAEHPGCYYRTVNGEKEWLNPPMMNYVEYRTTRRINGKAVYVTYNYVDTLEASPRSSEVIAEYKHGESIRIVNFSGGFYYNDTFYPISGAAGVGFIEEVGLLDGGDCITLYISHGETITKLTTVVEYIKN